MIAYQLLNSHEVDRKNKTWKTIYSNIPCMQSFQKSNIKQLIRTTEIGNKNISTKESPEK